MLCLSCHGSIARHDDRQGLLRLQRSAEHGGSLFQGAYFALLEMGAHDLAADLLMAPEALQHTPFCPYCLDVLERQEVSVAQLV